MPLVRLAMIKERELPYRITGENVDNPEKVVELAGQLLGIPVEDHVIIGDGYFSFREQELLNYNGRYENK